MTERANRVLSIADFLTNGGEVQTDDRRRVLLVLSDDGNEIKAMENPEATAPLFYTVTRKASTA